MSNPANLDCRFLKFLLLFDELERRLVAVAVKGLQEVYSVVQQRDVDAVSCAFNVFVHCCATCDVDDNYAAYAFAVYCQRALCRVGIYPDVDLAQLLVDAYGSVNGDGCRCRR